MHYHRETMMFFKYFSVKHSEAQTRKEERQGFLFLIMKDV